MSQKILIVDDDLLMRKLASFHLEENGYEVSSVRGGNECLSFVKDCIPDLIILDIMMPKMDGVQTCLELRKLEKLSSIPIVMLTASGEYFDSQEWSKIGANGYLAKPFSPKKLLEVIKQFLGE